MVKEIKLFIFFISVNLLVLAQNNIGFRFFGFTIHPRGEKTNARIMPLRLDKDAYFVLNPGCVIHYENKLYKDIFTIKVAQALYSDCAARLGGFSHIGFRGRILKKNNFSIYAGCGPTLVFRRNWIEIPEYINPYFFKGNANDKWQYKFIPYAGEVELKYFVSEIIEFAISLIPGYPVIINISLGLNYFFASGKKENNLS